MNISQFSQLKHAGKPIKMVTCYDYWTAKILAKTNIDAVLVGDSAAMVMHGYDSTLPAEMDMMVYHIKAVKKGIGDKLIVGDMPFLSYRKSLTQAMCAVEQIMQAGASAIKLEGVVGNEEIISHIVSSGVPVMGHLGFTPQSIHMFGNKLVQGRNQKDAEELVNAAKRLEELGCFAIVLECVPAELGDCITAGVNVPTIGIGAGSKTSGQILVLQDLLGVDPDFNPKFLKKYLNLDQLMLAAVNDYCHEIEEGLFPSNQHCYEQGKSANN